MSHTRSRRRDQDLRLHTIVLLQGWLKSPLLDRRTQHTGKRLRRAERLDRRDRTGGHSPKREGWPRASRRSAGAAVGPSQTRTDDGLEQPREHRGTSNTQREVTANSLMLQHGCINQRAGTRHA
ncbi:MAG: hypothetical protein ACRD3C_25155 [Vicinamibacterales bacterium]